MANDVIATGSATYIVTKYYDQRDGTGYQLRLKLDNGTEKVITLTADEVIEFLRQRKEQS